MVCFVPPPKKKGISHTPQVRNIRPMEWYCNVDVQFVSPVPTPNEALRVTPCRGCNLSSSHATQVWLALN
jgi:hypothetical protein